MLDLKKLEEKLDSALANETSETLTNWLQEKRLRALLHSIGEGVLENMSDVCDSEKVLIAKSPNFEVHSLEVSDSEDYQIAA